MYGKLALPGVNLHIIDDWLHEEEYSMAEVGEVLPCIFCIIKSDLTLEYINPVGFEWLNIPAESFLCAHKHLFEQYNRTVALQDFLIGVKPYLSNVRTDEVYHDLQKVWFPSTSEYHLCIISVKRSHTSGKHIVMMQPLSDIHYLKQKIGRLAEEEIFYLNNYDKFKQLTDREIEVVTLISKGLNNPQISAELAISRKTVEQHRKNINRKLGTSSLVELIKYAQVFDLQY